MTAQTIQMTAIVGRTATIRREDGELVEMSYRALSDALQEEGYVGLVYRWLMREYSRCELEQRNGRPWASPARTVASIVAEMVAMRNQECAAQKAAQAEASECRERAERAAADRRELEDVAEENRRLRAAGDGKYIAICEREIPSGIRFDTLGRDQGQMVEVSFGTFDRSEAGRGDPYMRIINRSDRSVAYYRRVR